MYILCLWHVLLMSEQILRFFLYELLHEFLGTFRPLAPHLHKVDKIEPVQSNDHFVEQEQNVG